MSSYKHRQEVIAELVSADLGTRLDEKSQQRWIVLLIFHGSGAGHHILASVGDMGWERCGSGLSFSKKRALLQNKNKSGGGGGGLVFASTFV